MIKYSIRYSGFVLALSMSVIFGCTCAAPKPTPDPLAGWHFSSLVNLHSNKMIMDDYQDYVRKLSLKKEDFVGSVDFSEDGKGQHAVSIGIGIDGTWWDHVLIYDKDNKRIKVIKYRNGGYRS